MTYFKGCANVAINFSFGAPWYLQPENTQLLCKGKYHWMADLLFDQLGFGQTSKSVYSFNSTKQLNPNQSNRRSAVQWYFLLQSKWVFSASTLLWLLLQRNIILMTDFNLDVSLFVICQSKLKGSLSCWIEISTNFLRAKITAIKFTEVRLIRPSSYFTKNVKNTFPFKL